MEAMMQCPKTKHSLKDKISSLPTDILVHILSFLTLKEAVRTSVLSKYWKDLWMFAGRLNLEDPDVDPEALWLYRDVELASQCKFIEWVNKVLEKHKALELEEFRICFDLNCDQVKDIDKWVQYAFARRVQVLELDPSRYDGRVHENPYCFHLGLLGLSSGKISEESPSIYSGRATHNHAKIDFRCLRSLTLVNVHFNDDGIKLILEKFCFVERLIIRKSENLGNVEVCGPSLVLQHLELWACKGVKSIIVSNSNLVSLTISVGVLSSRDRSLKIENVPRLVNVYVRGWFLLREIIPVLSDCLSKLEVLTLDVLSHNYVRQEMDVVNIVELPKLPKLKKFFLVATASNEDTLIPYTNLMRASPNLEKFKCISWLFS